MSEKRKRGRPPRTTPKTGVDKSPLNAKVDEQLLLDFNGFSQDPKNWRGTRDELVEFVLKAFLDSPRKPARRVESTSIEDETQALVASMAGGARRAVDVIARARRHAEAIVLVTTMGTDLEDVES